jgi:putative heme-binding domain-containing protein
VRGLGESGAADAASALRTRFVGEPDPGVRRAVLGALGTLRDGGSRSLISGILRDPRADLSLKAEALAAAERVGGQDVAGAVSDALKAARPDSPLLAAAIATLGRLRYAPAAPGLESLAAESDDETARAACEALADIGGDIGRDALVRLADRAAPGVRRGAVAALGRLGPSAALPRLLAAYHDPETKATALAALAQMPDPRALEAYLDGLGGKNANVRAACLNAIGQIRDIALPRIEAQADRLAPVVVGQLRRIYQGHAGASGARLFAAATETPPPEGYWGFAREHAGDPARGRALFLDRDGLGCVKCHRVGGEGGDIGPDLSTVGAQLDRAKLAESILYPSRSIREGYQQLSAATADGRVVSGLVRSETGETLILRDAEGRDHMIPKAKIEGRTNANLSLMPEGLHVGLSRQDFADLISFLESLKSSAESADVPAANAGLRRSSRPLQITPR